MSHIRVVLKRDHISISSFTSGEQQVSLQFEVRTEEDALARALWLERRGKEEEAELFLETWLSKNR